MIHLETNERLALLEAKLAQNRAEAIEWALKFPLSKEAYLELEAAKRMDVAARLMERFAQLEDKDERVRDSAGIEALVPVDESDVTLTARMGFLGCWDRSRSHRGHPAIRVQASLDNPSEGISSGYLEVGRVSFGPQPIEVDGEISWTHEPCFIPATRNFTELPLDDPQALPVLDMVDAGAIKLLEREVFPKQRLGAVAVEGAAL